MSTCLLRYATAMLAASLVWEAAQLPFYTLWREGSRREIAEALLHCTAGDLVIAMASLGVAWALAGRGRWPAEPLAYRHVAFLAIAFGIAYAIFSEWLNVEIRRSWAYSELMPRVPPLGTGLSPLLQWLLVPWLAFRIARPGRDGHGVC